MQIANISIKRPTLAVVAFIVLTMFGTISFFSLNYELLPKFSPGVVMVITVYPGASPGEVENTVTKKIEDAVGTMENVKYIDATSFESLSTVMIMLTDNADVDLSLNEAQRKINAILSDLPDDAEIPSLQKFSTDDLPIMTLSATSGLDDASFYDLLDKQVQPLLSQVEGVAQVNLVGGREREIQVNINADQLQGYGLSILHVQQAILTSNLDFPTGSIKSKNQDILIRLAGKFTSVDELRDLIILNSPDGSQIRLKDVADVQDAQKDFEKIARIDRQSALAMQILKQSDANAVQVSRDIQQRIIGLENIYHNEGLKIIVADDSTDYTLHSANAVLIDLILAIVLVGLIMLLFLHSLRNALIVMIAIPLSLIATFAGMYLLGFSLNLMSLVALSLVVGILVDDAIVVIENIYRHMEMGKNVVRASIEGTKEIGFTVISITLVIVVVFLPISLTSGMVSMILREFTLVVVIAVLMSLLTSFTIVPMLTSRFGRLENIEGKNIFGKFILWFERQLDRFSEWIAGILRWALRYKILTLGLVLALLVASFSLITQNFISTEFMPQGDRGEFMVQIELPKEASLEETNMLTRKAEDFLTEKDEIVSLITVVGESSSGGLATLSPTYESQITVKLVDAKERKESSDIYAALIKKDLQKLLVGAKVKTTPVNIMGMAERAPVEMIVMGNDLDSITSYADQVLTELKKIPGVSEAKLSAEAGNPEISVQVDRDKMAALGLNLQTVGATMQVAFNGNTDGKYRMGQYEYDINIRFEDFNRKSIEDVRNIQFVNDKGQSVKLSQFAVAVESSGPSQLERRDKSAAVKVQSQVVGRTTSDVVADLEKAIENIPAPIGVHYIWGGEMESQAEGFGSLMIALFISIFMVYFIMVALYDSFAYPLVVMFSIPLSIIGALLALALTNNALNIFTILGSIMLIGLVAKNAIILVDFINLQKSEGKSTYDALFLANKARLRPILITMIAMAIGMLPIAMATGPGAEIKNGLAWVIIGGLLSSLFLTLIVVPVVYQIMDWILEKLGMNKEGLPIEELAVEPYEPVESVSYVTDNGR